MTVEQQAEGDPAGLVVGRRQRQLAARPKAVGARFSQEEFAVLTVAAERAGLTVTSYVAAMAVAMARGQVHPLPAEMGEAEMGEALRALVEARTALARYGGLLNQSVAKLHSTGVADGALVAAVTRCTEAVVSVRAATELPSRARRHRN